jgi:hypothetical protein
MVLTWEVGGFTVPTEVLTYVLSLLQLFARAWYTVSLYDISEDQLEGAKVAIQAQLEGLQKDGLLREGQTASQLLGAVTFSSNLEAVIADAIHIQVRKCMQFSSIGVVPLPPGQRCYCYWLSQCLGVCSRKRGAKEEGVLRFRWCCWR